MIRWTPLIAAALLALLSACSSSKTVPQVNPFESGPSVQAAGGNNSGSTSPSSLELINLTASSSLRSSSSQPIFGDEITFKVTSSLTQPWVQVRCYQGTALIFSEVRGMFDGYAGAKVYALGPTSVWLAGSASCKAELVTTGRRKLIVLATLPFEVLAQ